jgi:hypothetical protein
MDADGTSLAVLFARIDSNAVPGDRRTADAVSACLAGLKAAVEKYSGTVVKTVGGELIAHFDFADLALRAASAMQAAMRGRSDGLELKVGFTVGPVIRDGGDVFGDTVNLAARVVSIANPRQILTTRQVADRLPPYLRSVCRDIDSISVKGKTEEIPVYEVVWQQDKATTVVGDPLTRERRSPATLKLFHRGRTWNLGDGRDALAAGRDPASDIVVTGENVSRLHARFFLRQGKFVIADQSANGTYLHMLQREEILLHREEFVLLGRGRIGLGQSVADMGDDAISFEVG